MDEKKANLTTQETRLFCKIIAHAGVYGIKNTISIMMKNLNLKEADARILVNLAIDTYMRVHA